MNVRVLAARTINDVTNGQSLSDCLPPRLASLKDARDRAFLQALCYGACRYYSRLDVILSKLLQKPMNAKDSDVHALLITGLYQLMDMRVPPHAAVAETVNASEKLKKPWSRGLINAILREFIRQREKIEMEIAEDEEAQYAHPDWWISSIKKAWPDHWKQILSANNQHPPFSLRVNQRKLSRDAYLEKLREKEISAQVIPHTLSGIVLESPVDVVTLPGFNAGEISVQDGAAQLAAELLELAPQQRVLDACSAPGGKLAHMLEMETQLAEVIAIEKAADRIAPIRENLSRLQLQAKCICSDATQIQAWWDKQPFDRILLDAPCSASGVIRRHPDIKLLREPNDIAALSRLQLQLLEALWQTLAPGGLLVYVTCSIFPKENVDVMRTFLSSHQDASEEKIHAKWGVACDIGRQILPGMDDMDGFYYARLRKHQ